MATTNTVIESAAALTGTPANSTKKIKNSISQNIAIALIEKKNEVLVDSRLMAEHLVISHEAVLKTIDSYLNSFEQLNPLRFEFAKGELLPQGGRAKATRYALLSEDQSYLLLTFSRNNPRVVELKVRLIKAFSRFRREQQTATDYLPFYHELHDAIKSLSEYALQNGSNATESIFHMQYNKLINKSCGITSKQRESISVCSRVNITNATAAIITTIKRGIVSGTDYHDIYKQAKANVISFSFAENVLTGDSEKQKETLGG
jgi:phage regulator Rha-like protein